MNGGLCLEPFNKSLVLPLAFFQPLTQEAVLLHQGYPVCLQLSDLLLEFIHPCFFPIAGTLCCHTVLQFPSHYLFLPRQMVEPLPFPHWRSGDDGLRDGDFHLGLHVPISRCDDCGGCFLRRTVANCRDHDSLGNAHVDAGSRGCGT